MLHDASSVIFRSAVKVLALWITRYYCSSSRMRLVTPDVIKDIETQEGEDERTLRGLREEIMGNGLISMQWRIEVDHNVSPTLCDR